MPWLPSQPLHVELPVQLSFQGALSVDEALSLCQAVCGGNSRSMGFILMPQPHSSAAHSAILSHRRLLEDKATAILAAVQKFMLVSSYIEVILGIEYQKMVFT